jgi:hypothetical protein
VRLEALVSNSSQRATVASYRYRVLSLFIAFIVKMELIRSSETSVPTRTTWWPTSEDDILQVRTEVRHVRLFINIQKISLQTTCETFYIIANS